MSNYEKEAAIRELKKKLKPGDDVYTIVRHVARSGMSRSIDLYIARKREIISITWLVSKALEENIDRNHGGIRIAGCGMDMGFALVYDMGRVMWPKGTRKPHGTRNGVPDTDGGYALKQRWLS